MILYTCTKFCESISKGFRITDLNSRVNARVVATVDAGRTDIRTHARTDEWTEGATKIIETNTIIICMETGQYQYDVQQNNEVT